jgi:prephenate dehydrogenase
MPVRITIIGLGQIGGSFGLALAEQKDMFQRVGHDRNPEISKLAQKMGAVEQVSINLPASVRDSEIVLLALPVDQIRETIEIIAPDLREDVVLLDTSPVKEVVTAWAKELLPANRHYVGLTPVLNPNYLMSLDFGINAARADLFRGGLMGIVAPPRTPSEAIKLAADLARIVGAEGLFFDPVEVDSLMAATHILPQLVSAAVLNATIDQPGWHEARKIAGRAYASVTSPSIQFTDSQALASSAMLSRENVLRVLDGMIAALQALRADMSNEDHLTLQNRLERARSGRELWWSQRQAANWEADAVAAPEVSTGSEMFGRLFGIRRKKKGQS